MNRLSCSQSSDRGHNDTDADTSTLIACVMCALLPWRAGKRGVPAGLNAIEQEHKQSCRTNLFDFDCSSSRLHDKFSTAAGPWRACLQAPTSVSDVRQYYKDVGKNGAIRDAFLLPGEFARGLGDPVPALPEAPIIVLINSKSGGRVGPECTTAMRRALGYAQVRHLASLRMSSL